MASLKSLTCKISESNRAEAADSSDEATGGAEVRRDRGAGARGGPTNVPSSHAMRCSINPAMVWRSALLRMLRCSNGGRREAAQAHAAGGLGDPGKEG